MPLGQGPSRVPPLSRGGGPAAEADASAPVQPAEEKTLRLRQGEKRLLRLHKARICAILG